jgi:hypothetical protein
MDSKALVGANQAKPGGNLSVSNRRQGVIADQRQGIGCSRCIKSREQSLLLGDAKQHRKTDIP